MGLRSGKALVVLAIIIPLIIIPTVILGVATPRVEAQAIRAAMTKTIEWSRVPIEAVPMSLGSTIDIYLYGVTPMEAAELARRPDIILYQAVGGFDDLLLNPASVMVLSYPGKITAEEASKRLNIPVEAVAYVDFDGNTSHIDVCVKPPVDPKAAGFGIERDVTDKYLINPLCFRQVRFAFNYIVDRDFIVRQILQGFGIPYYSVYGPADPIYVDLVDIVAKYRFSYDPSYAAKLVSDIMTKVGATKVGGYWYYRGQPITLTLISRVEDERRDIGRLVANAIDQYLGFKVNVLELTYGEATVRVRNTDPMDFQWHIYTEGFGPGTLDRWYAGALAHMAAPSFRRMPGWGVKGYWQYKNSTLDELCQILTLGKYKSKEEFLNYLRLGVEMSIQESVRIWIVAPLYVYPAVKDLMGVTQSLMGGPSDTVLNARNWYIPGRDTIRVGHLWVWTSASAWNNFGGFGDLYSGTAMRATRDPGIWRHPFNGEPLPVRTPGTVITAGPDGTLDVPPDAVRWDPAKGWVPVGPGTKAISVAIFDLSLLLGYQWHHGINITWADIIGDLALRFDVTYNTTKANLEPELAASNKLTYDAVVAIRPLINESKLEIYLNFWHFDPLYILDYLTPAPYVPFEIDFAEVYLAYDKQTYALTRTRARSQGIPWLSLALSDHAKDVKAALLELRNLYDYVSRYTNIPGVYTMSRDEWNSRIDAAIKWIDTYGNAWISDGPFMLVYYSVTEQKLVLQRFEGRYPIQPSQLYFGIPTPNRILEISAPMVNPGADLLISMRVSGEFPLYIFYMISDPTTKQIIYADKTTTSSENVRIVIPGDVTAMLRQYSYYDFIVVVWSDTVALPAERTIVLTTGLSVSAIPEISQRVSELEQRISNIASSLAEISSSLTAQIANVSAALSTLRAETMGAVIQAVSAGFINISNAITGMTANLTSSISGMGSALTEVLTSDINSINSSINSLRSDITALRGEVEASRSAIDELSSSIQSLNSAISTLNAAVIVLLAVAIINLALGVILVIRRR